LRFRADLSELNVSTPFEIFPYDPSFLKILISGTREVLKAYEHKEKIISNLNKNNLEKTLKLIDRAQLNDQELHEHIIKNVNDSVLFKMEKIVDEWHDDRNKKYDFIVEKKPDIK
jgi:hypothetical protein